MKRLTAAILALMLVLAFVGCGAKTAAAPETMSEAVLRGTVTEIRDGVLVIASENDPDRYFCAEIISMPSSPEPLPGDTVEVTYNGMATEEDPAALCGVSSVRVIRKTEASRENAVCIDNVMYYSTGKEVPAEPDESVIEYVEIPFGSSETGITAFAMLEEGKTLLCLIDHEWVEFTAR